MLDEHRDNMTGIYAQLEYRFTPQLKAVGAARFDRSTLTESQVSPKLALVYSPVANHTFRVTYNRAFQAPNYSELFLSILHPAKLLAYYGNNALKVEKIGGLEFGYKGILNSSAFITLDAYYNDLSDFITDLSPGANPAYHGQELINGQLRTVWSYGNAGKVTETGAELGVNYYFSDAWSLNLNYAYFDFSIVEQSLGDPIQPNAPRHKMNGTLTYRSGGRFEGSVGVKTVPSFDWAAGIYQGRILAYTLVNLAASYHITNQVQLALNVSNLLDREHYEIFGGSLLRRRAIASTTVTF
jgi:iron complex outermembrane receptor protein